jgi:hippurate hydrolase
MSNPVEQIRRFQPELAAIRHDIHAHPELAFEEHRTADIVARRLTEWGIEVHRGLAGTGVVGVVHGRGGEGTVGLRADMDCLPMHETGNVPYRSRHEGHMHACGHDGHTTMLLGAARYLAQTRSFAGTAYLIFQPAEERGGGGKLMVEEGLFERFPAREVYALHNWPALPAGQIAVRPGPVMAAVDEIEIVIRGKGGRGAMPHLTVDPVVAAAQVITALQTIASRNVSPLDAIVVSVCSMQTSQVGAFNVIPDDVRLIGTVRMFREETRMLAERRIAQIATSVATGLGATAEPHYRRHHPATVNSEREAHFAARVGERIFGAGNVIRDADPTTGSEDFSYMLQSRPGAYVWLGQGGGPSGCQLHNPGYDFNDAVIPLGAGFLAALVEEALPQRAES